jgi:hypothetical protein
MQFSLTMKTQDRWHDASLVWDSVQAAERYARATDPLFGESGLSMRRIVNGLAHIEVLQEAAHSCQPSPGMDHAHRRRLKTCCI